MTHALFINARTQSALVAPRLARQPKLQENQAEDTPNTSNTCISSMLNTTLQHDKTASILSPTAELITYPPARKRHSYYSGMTRKQAASRQAASRHSRQPSHSSRDHPHDEDAHQSVTSNLYNRANFTNIIFPVEHEFPPLPHPPRINRRSNGTQLKCPRDSHSARGAPRAPERRPYGASRLLVGQCLRRPSLSP